MNPRRDRPNTAEEAKQMQAAGVRYGYRQQRRAVKDRARKQIASGAPSERSA
jgi:hypothetical protein